MSHPNNKLPTLFLILSLLPLHIDALSFNFSSFGFNQTHIEMEGDAEFHGTSIYLNYPHRDSVGRSLYHKAMQLWEVSGTTTRIADFTTHFTFQILNVSGYEGNGHGLTFVLLPENTKLFSESFGGLLGLFESDQSGYSDGINNQIVAVEFDTYQDDWDPSTHHIGIDVNSIRSKNYTNVTNGFIDKGMANVLVDYNSTTKNLSASLTFAGNSKSYDVSYAVDLSVVLPERVRVGFTASTKGFVEIHQVYAWSFESSIEETFGAPPSLPPQGPLPSSPPPQGINKVGLVVGISAGLFAVILIAGVVLFWFRSRRKVLIPSPEDQSPWIEHPGPRRFSYAELSKATNNFDDKMKLGEGGFGDVYKGLLANSNVNIAVKRFKGGSTVQGEKEYASEVIIISMLRHKNLVQLKGWCHEKRELLIAYEFLPNRSLDFHLFGKNLPLLTWPMRYKIAADLATAVHYLQDGCDPFVLHRDIKSSNIMLDSNFNAKLGDFGLARLTNQGHSFKTTVPAGTLGYLAPEVISSGKVSKGSDTYSFGVVALEIACGRRPVLQSEEDANKQYLVEWVWDLYGKGSILGAVDVRLNGEFDEDQARQLMVVGLWCCHPDPRLRPSIKQVQAMLNFEAIEPNLPSTVPRPIYVSSTTETSLLSSNASSVGAEAGSSTATRHVFTTSSTTITK